MTCSFVQNSEATMICCWLVARGLVFNDAGDTHLSPPYSQIPVDIAIAFIQGPIKLPTLDADCPQAYREPISMLHP